MVVMENTTMKKSIIIIAFAILMVASVFADVTQATKKTEVLLTLKKDPKYKVAITKTALDVSTTTTTVNKETDLDHVDKIELEYLKDSLKFRQKDSDTFYLSFLFYEYATVTLSMKINAPLTRYEGDTAKTTDDDKIDYKVTVEKANNNMSVEISGFDLTANGTSTKDEVVKYTDTTKIGEIRFASLKLTVGPTNADQTVKGKIEGTYKSTITLTATTT